MDKVYGAEIIKEDDREVHEGFKEVIAHCRNTSIWTSQIGCYVFNLTLDISVEVVGDCGAAFRLFTCVKDKAEAVSIFPGTCL